MHIRTGLIVFLCLTFASCAAAKTPPVEEFTIKNAGLSRTISIISGLLKTTKLEANGLQMLDGPSVEFMIDLDYKGEAITLVPSDFLIKGVGRTVRGKETRFHIELHSTREGLPLVIYVDYFLEPQALCLRKSVKIEPCKGAKGAIVRGVTIDYFQLKENMTSVAPADRYAGNAEDDPKADLADTKTRFVFDRGSDFAAIDPKAGKGIYFFVESLFGREGCSRARSVTMAEETYTPLEKGFETGRAIIGSVAGPPEVLYKRFREFLWNYYCVMRGKPMLVEYETWMNERQDVSEQKCLDAMKAMREEGYFNAFHLDYGWEDHYPLTDDLKKFPKGIPYLAEQAKSMGLGMVYWVNPLGSKGQTTDQPTWGGMWDELIRDHPDWFVTYDPVSNPAPKGTDILCFTSPYADFVEEKLLRLVTDCNAAMLYIDGNDWNTFKCPPSGPYHVDEKELPFVVQNRFKAIYDRLRKANPQLIICLSPQVGNQLSHAHRLNTIDQIEFWDGTAEGCLGDRQQRYNQAFVFPPYTMNAGWYMTDMALPFPQVKYAVIGTISDYPQLQGTQQIKSPSPELSAYLKRFYAFRKKFESYFEVYQHVLDFPDGQRIDGEGHIIDNKGFIVLFNPSEKPQKVALPLDEPGLELKGELKLTDWTEFDSGTPMGAAKPGDKVEVELAGMSAKIVGVNVGP